MQIRHIHIQYILCIYLRDGSHTSMQVLVDIFLLTAKAPLLSVVLGTNPSLSRSPAGGFRTSSPYQQVSNLITSSIEYHGLADLLEPKPQTRTQYVAHDTVLKLLD